MKFKFVDFYKILEIEKTATKEEIKAAYRKKAKEHHPDVSKDKDNGLFCLVGEAYRTLSNESKRKEYDTNRSSLIDTNSPYEVALKLIVDLFEQKIDYCAIYEQDIVKIMKQQIDSTIRNCESEKEASIKAIIKLEKVREKIIIQENSDLEYFFTLIDNKIENHKKLIKKQESLVIIFQQARSMLDMIEWKEEKKNSLISSAGSMPPLTVFGVPIGDL